MFGLFKKKTDVIRVKDTTPGVHYDAFLIDRFTREHQELLEQFGLIQSYAETGQYHQVQKAIHLFAVGLRDHLLTENIKLYIYLAKAFENDEDTHELIKDFRREMMQIGKVVNQFVTRYDTPEWSDAMKADFLGELLSIGEVLVERIKREEEVLYPLYMESDQYRNVS